MGSGAGGIYECTYGSRKTAESDIEPSIGERPRQDARPIRSDATTKYANDKPRNLEENADNVRTDYSLHEDGYFAEKGSRVNRRVYKSDDVLRDAHDFFSRISTGAQKKDNAHVDELRVFEDGSFVSFRRETSTPNSPAVEISRSNTPVVKDQKIHFVGKE